MLLLFIQYNFLIKTEMVKMLTKNMTRHTSQQNSTEQKIKDEISNKTNSILVKTTNTSTTNIQSEHNTLEDIDNEIAKLFGEHVKNNISNNESKYHKKQHNSNIKYTSSLDIYF